MIEVLSWCLELLAVVGCLHKFEQKKIKADPALLLLIIYDIVLFYGINHLNVSMGLSISFYIAIFIYSLFRFGESVRVTLTDCILAVILVGIMQLIFCIPARLIAWNPDRYILNACIVNGLCFIAVMVGGRILHLSTIATYIKQKSILTYLCMGCMLGYLLMNVYNLRTHYSISEMRYAEMLVWLLLILIMWIQVQKNRTEKEEKELQLLEQEQYIQSFEEQLEKVKRKQHDFKNHLSVFQGISEKGADRDERILMQKEYMNYLLQDEEYRCLVRGGHPIFTGFLNRKIQEMESKNIDFRYEIAYVKLSGFTVYEWIEIAGILLDNAIEAVEGGQQDRKKIFMELHQDSNSTVLKVANTSRYVESEESEKFFGLGYSSKGNDRGIGLAKVKEIVKKQDGEILVKNVEKENSNWLEFCVCVYRK